MPPPFSGGWTGQMGRHGMTSGLLAAGGHPWFSSHPLPCHIFVACPHHLLCWKKRPLIVTVTTSDEEGRKSREGSPTGGASCWRDRHAWRARCGAAPCCCCILRRLITASTALTAHSVHALSSRRGMRAGRVPSLTSLLLLSLLFSNIRTLAGRNIFHRFYGAGRTAGCWHSTPPNMVCLTPQAWRGMDPLFSSGRRSLRS